MWNILYIQFNVWQFQLVTLYFVRQVQNCKRCKQHHPTKLNLSATKRQKCEKSSFHICKCILLIVLQIFASQNFHEFLLQLGHGSIILINQAMPVKINMINYYQIKRLICLSYPLPKSTTVKTKNLLMKAE